jgi:hypothetical protein
LVVPAAHTSSPVKYPERPFFWGIARLGKYLRLQERAADELDFLQIEWRLWA